MTTAPIVSLLLLYVAFVGYLIFSAKRLPDRVASHFGFKGQPDQRMSRSVYLTLMALMGLVIPLVLPSVLLLSRKDDPYLVRHAVWFGCLLLGLLFGAHALVVQANRQLPAKISNLIWALLALFLAGTILWWIVLVYRL